MQPDLASIRAFFERVQAKAQAQADECSRFLALSDTDLEAAYDGKLDRHDGWGDPSSPERYLK